MPTYPPTYLPACLPAGLPTYSVPTYLPTHNVPYGSLPDYSDCLPTFVYLYPLNLLTTFYVSEGRRTWLRHLRDGRELPDIARDDHYDFNFQVSILSLSIFHFCLRKTTPIVFVSDV